MFGGVHKGDGTGIVGVSQGGVGVWGKGGRLAGVFEGNVEITGDLTVQGVSIQSLRQQMAGLQSTVDGLQSTVDWLLSRVNELQLTVAALASRNYK